MTHKDADTGEPMMPGGEDSATPWRTPEVPSLGEGIGKHERRQKRERSWKGRLFFIVRHVLALMVLGGMVLLVHWNRAHDPRFYAFVNSPVGRQIFSWVAPQVIADLAEADEINSVPLSPEESEVKEKLERQIAAAWPTHRLRMRDGRVFLGKLLSQDSGGIQFQESFRGQGAVSFRASWNTVDQVEHHTASPPQISSRDVRLQTELPHMELYRRPPYTLITGSGFFGFEKVVSELDRLHDQFIERFDPLISRARDQEHIQVVFFPTEAEFRSYQHKDAKGAENAVGYYLRHKDRLVFFDYLGSHNIRDVHGAIDTQINRLRSKGLSAREQEALSAEERRVRSAVNMRARDQTYQILRHEGAHQLFFSYGVHSAHQSENTWLVEGLAGWMENDPPERVNHHSLESLASARDNGQLFAWDWLVDYRSSEGFSPLNNTAGHGDAASLAYAQSWLLCHLLMRAENRPRFFEYVRFVRERENLSKVMSRPRSALLSEMMGWQDGELSARCNAYLRRL